MQAPPPPAVSIARSMLWNWWVVLLSVVVFVAIGAAVGMIRTPEHTATTRLAVGRIDITSPGALSGYAIATQALATGYSRTVTAQPIARRVAARTGIPVEEVKSHVSATPVAESPIFRIEATSPDEQEAIDLANLSARGLVRYAATLNQNNPDTARLYRQYGEAVVDRRLTERQVKSAAVEAESRPSAAAEAELREARAALEAANLRVDALGKAYTASVQSQVATQLIQVVSPATDATSDRRSMLFILGFIGLVVGLLVGGALAVLRESRLRPAH